MHSTGLHHLVTFASYLPVVKCPSLHGDNTLINHTSQLVLCVELLLRRHYRELYCGWRQSFDRHKLRYGLVASETRNFRACTVPQREGDVTQKQKDGRERWRIRQGSTVPKENVTSLPIKTWQQRSKNADWRLFHDDAGIFLFLFHESGSRASESLQSP